MGINRAPEMTSLDKLIAEAKKKLLTKKHLIEIIKHIVSERLQRQNDVHNESYAPSKHIKRRQKIIKALIFSGIIGYASVGYQFYGSLRALSNPSIGAERKRISEQPVPTVIADAHLLACGQHFGYAEKGPRYENFDRVHYECKEDRDCRVVSLSAKDVVDPGEYELSEDGKSVLIDGKDYYFFDFSSKAGNVYVIAAQIIKPKDFLVAGEFFIAKPFLVGAAKFKEGLSVTGLRKISRANARKNLHQAYIWEYGPKTIIVVNPPEQNVGNKPTISK